jgi:UDP-N-acetylmuramoyl-tripeptide--D-alanyl-D-alanine ligase
MFPFADFLHILQLENYDTQRYLRRLEYLFFRRDLQRLEQLKWTSRVKLTAILAAGLTILGILFIPVFYLVYIGAIVYFLFNRNGPKWLWGLFLLFGASFHTLHLVSGWLWTENQLSQLLNYVGWGYVVSFLILIVLSGLKGNFSFPRKGFIWWILFILAMLVLAFSRPPEPLVIIQVIILLFAFSVMFIPVWVAVANMLLEPIYDLAKQLIYFKAKTYLQKHCPQLKIILVAGSYGKTTTKNFLYELVKYNYRTQIVPGNINTAIGLSKWVLRHLDPHTQILIAEADGYDAEEYMATGSVLSADYLILTNVGDQHLERFGSRENLAKALLKLLLASKTTAKIVLSQDTWQDYDTWKINLQKQLAPRAILVADLNQKPTYQGKVVKYKHLSESNQDNLKLALLVAEDLQIPKAFVLDTVSKLEPPERRQQVREMFGFTVVDDSYNISLNTAKAGLEQAWQLAKQQQKELVVIFAGIPEADSQEQQANVEIAQHLVEKADYLLLLQSIFAPMIAKSLTKFGFSNLYSAKSMAEAWQIIQQKFSPEKHLILMQPELTDLYYAFD